MSGLKKKKLTAEDETPVVGTPVSVTSDKEEYAAARERLALKTCAVCGNTTKESICSVDGNAV